MRRVFVLTMLLPISLLFITNCQKECDCESQNHLEFANNSIPLNKAILENWGVHVQDEAYQGYRLIVGAFSPEVTIHISDFDVDSLSGRGHGILFELFSSEPNNFSSADFTYSMEHTTGTFSFGLLYHDFLFEHDDWLEEEFINSGNLALTVNDDKLTLEFTGHLESGELVTAYYSGEYIFRELLVGLHRSIEIH